MGTVGLGLLGLYGQKKNESVFYFYNIGLSILFVLAAAFFIVICVVILRQKRDIRHFEWLTQLITAYCKSLIVVLGKVS